MKTRFGSALACLALLVIGGAGGCQRDAGEVEGSDAVTAGGTEVAYQEVEEREPAIHGWLNWRGPQQDGTSLETNLPGEWEPEGGVNDLWTVPIRGRGAPVVAGDRLYAIGYVGETDDLREVVFCADAATGEIIWEHYFSDFLSDTIYNRYSIGSPTIDPETGNVYVLTTPGVAAAFDPDGELLWEISMMEQYGRLTFPNGRTGAPVVDGDQVIIHCIAGNWGGEGPTRDRFYSFDKTTGDLIWSSDPGIGPPYLRDSSFSTPFLHDLEDGRRAFYAGTGDGNIVKVNARTGEPIWRSQFAEGGVNSSVVRADDKLVVMHGLENVDSSRRGRVAALDANVAAREPGEGEGNNPILEQQEAELWRIDGLEVFSSSPVVVDGRIYVVDWTGVLRCIDLETGEMLWSERLGPHQLHASPLYADGKLYVGLPNGSFYILEIQDDGVEVLTEVELEGDIFGTPTAWNGRVYIFTTEKLYAFGAEEGNASENLPEPKPLLDYPSSGEAVALRVIPGEVMMRAGSTEEFRLQRLDETGRVVDEVAAEEAQWAKHIPEAALVRSEMDAEFEDQGRLTAAPEAAVSAGAFRAEHGGLEGFGRGRVLSSPPFEEDFSRFELDEHHARDDEAYAYPPLPWIGARFRWEIREHEGVNVLTKSLDNVLFQRAVTFVGHPGSSGYTVQADVLTDGDRRLMSDVGVINQRYIITLRGNHQQVEVTSNSERLSASEQYFWEPGEWHTIKTEVEIDEEDGSGVVRAKIWPRDSAEPGDWLIEVPVDHAHTQGAPGIYGFTPQNRHRVYVDNLIVRPNED